MHSPFLLQPIRLLAVVGLLALVLPGAGCREVHTKASIHEEPVSDDIFNKKAGKTKAVSAKSSFEMVQRVYEQRYLGCPKKEANCTYVKVSLPVIKKSRVKSFNKEDIARVNRFLENEFAVVQKVLPVEQIASGVFDDYTAQKKSVPGYDIPWLLERDIKIIGISDTYLSLMVSEFEFMGGAHPNTRVNFFMFALPQIEPLSLESVVIEGQMQKLLHISEKYFRKEKGLPADHSFSSMGYEFSGNSFHLPQNIALGEDELLLFYNQYEIAAYVAGWTALRIPFTELRGIIKEKYRKGVLE